VLQIIGIFWPSMELSANSDPVCYVEDLHIILLPGDRPALTSASQLLHN
jgi:hypothetical protein